MLLQVALKALSLKGIKDWKQLELFQREAVVLQVSIVTFGAGWCGVDGTAGTCYCRIVCDSTPKQCEPCHT